MTERKNGAAARLRWLTCFVVVLGRSYYTAGTVKTFRAKKSLIYRVPFFFIRMALLAVSAAAAFA